MNALNDAKFLNARDFGALGSDYETGVLATADSNAFTVDDIGDFKVGEEVLIIGCNPHFAAEQIFNRRDPSPVNPRKYIHHMPYDGRVEVEGATKENWVVYMFDIAPDRPNHFRWTKDFCKTWSEEIEIVDGAFAEIDGDIRIKINDFEERHYGCTIIAIASSRMVALIEKIEGNTVYLSKSATASGKFVMQHSDTYPIQQAINAALKEKKSVYLPNGKYRLTSSLYIENATSFTFEGESGVDTILVNELGHLGIERPEGSCFIIRGGTEVNVKNVFMTGNVCCDERYKSGPQPVKGASGLWGFYLNKSNATYVHNTERVYIENCHARRMSAECFYAQSSWRKAEEEPLEYGRQITYMRCSVEDCARNAFNNNDLAECTSILYCRIKNVAGNSWEGASRFVKIIGCYIRDAGCLAFGNVRSRAAENEKLCTGQHIVSDNYFEGTCIYDQSMIRVGAAATQVIIKNNVFINFKSPAVEVFGEGGKNDLPSENVIVTGNSFDLSAIGGASEPRYAVRVTTNFVTVSDNQIFVRGERDENVTGIIVSDDAERVVIHDNTIVNAGVGIKTELVEGVVGYVVDNKTFYRMEKLSTSYTGVGMVPCKPMLLRQRSHRYHGWRIVWSDGSESEIYDFDPKAMTFTLSEPRDMKVGDKFNVYRPAGTKWSVHHNMIDNCTTPESLDSFGGRMAAFDNQIL